MTDDLVPEYSYSEVGRARRWSIDADAVRILGAGEPRMLGYADARVPHSAPGGARLLDAPLDESVGRLVAHIRQFRPEELARAGKGMNTVAHRSEVERGAAPGLLAGFAPDVRERFLSTEWYTRQDAVSPVSAQTELTA